MLEKRSQTRTHYIHRINYSTQERIVGSFVLIALFILLGLFLSSGKTQNLFEDYVTLYGELQSIQAINKDTDVTISGLSAGSVTSVDITEDNKILLTMKILKKYHNLLREDSVANLSSFNFAVVQKSVIEISAGSSQAALLKDGSTLSVHEAFNVKELIGKIEPIFSTLEDSIEKINNILTEIDNQKLGDSIKKINGILTTIDSQKLGETLNNVHAISTDISDISQQIQSGKGLIGSANYPGKMQNDVKAITINMVEITDDLKVMMKLLNKQIAAMPELINKIGPLLNEADKTIKASQRIWPLSSAIGEGNDKKTLTSPTPAND